MKLSELLTLSITQIQPLKVTQPTEKEIVSAADSITYIISKFGDMSTSKNEYFVNMYNMYLAVNQQNINRVYSAITAEYNSLDNNDVITEIVTLNKQDGGAMRPSAAKTSDFNKSFDGGLENTSYTNTEIVTAAESTPSNTMSETFQNDILNGYNSTNKVLERKHGNISAVTNQSIIAQEFELRLKCSMFDFIDKAVLHGGFFYDN